jgi:hypothetical protein
MDRPDEDLTCQMLKSAKLARVFYSSPWLSTAILLAMVANAEQDWTSLDTFVAVTVFVFMFIRYSVTGGWEVTIRDRIVFYR